LIRYAYSGSGFSAYPDPIGLYGRERLQHFFRAMLRIRLIEEDIEKRYHLDQMKTPIHLVIGQEATTVGACAALRLDDLVYSSHRTHGVYLAKGGDLKAMLCEMHCRRNGCVGSRGGSMHIIDPRAGVASTSAIVGGSIPIATGSALASKMRGEDRVNVVFFGEAATEEGVCSESLNFATLKQLPIVFLCENNFYSVQSPLATRQPDRQLWRWAEGHGLPALQVDGTNVLGVYDACHAAVARARSGGGPTFIEARVYRFRAHGGAGDDSKTGYRDVAEREAWERVCPLEGYFDFLKLKKVMSDADRKRMQLDIQEELSVAMEFALASAEPSEADLYLHAYAD
jgi:acetoin:2,6-dichlorophenolindophenol oxidoreductase subunit alpha